jgi:hypothetical protein
MDCGTEGYETDGYEDGVAGNVLTSALSSGTGFFAFSETISPGLQSRLGEPLSPK